VARAVRITRAFSGIAQTIGLQTRPLAFIAEGETLVRTRWALRVFYDPAPTTASTDQLTNGWAYGLYVDPDVIPSSPLDPYTDVNADWTWHEYVIPQYTVEGGDIIIVGPPGDPTRDSRAQRISPTGGMWLQWGIRSLPTTANDGWSASIGASIVIIEAP